MFGGRLPSTSRRVDRGLLLVPYPPIYSPRRYIKQLSGEFFVPVRAPQRLPDDQRFHLFKRQSEGDVQHILGRVVFDGDVPKLKPIQIKTEAAKGCCTDGSTVDNTDRSLMVSTAGGIANVVVTLTVPGATAAIPEGKVSLDQAKCRFEPHVSVVPIGATISFVNSDSVSHNVHTYSTIHATLNKTIAAGGSLDLKAEGAESITIGCDIHPWMKSYAVVRQ